MATATTRRSPKLRLEMAHEQLVAGVEAITTSDQWLAYLAVAGSLIGFTCYVWLIHHESPTKVGTYAYVNPVIALILGATLVSEHLTRRQIAGAALVICGVIATLTGKKRKGPSSLARTDNRIRAQRRQGSPPPG